eukprot:c15813_g1_i1.p1 GENE.c15813_g1_i1~~c15813_g1_i1.p1  ORF type:complete len:173 (+),score=10.61 c15813_g1_i1:881-1399(+)
MRKYGIDKLQSITVCGNNITSKGASVLFDTLKECNSNVSILDFYDNQLDDECMKQLGEYLQDNEYVNEMGLGGNEITDKGIEILLEYLVGNITLKELNLVGNKGITDASAPYLIHAIKKSCITKLVLTWIFISAAAKQEIDEDLAKPIEQREVPIKSSTKSAAKIQSSSASP